MSNQSGQRGIIPIPVIVAIALVSLAAGLFGGYQLGDGTFFSFGVGFGIVFVILLFSAPYINSLIDLRNRFKKKK
jgi:hypothetical protein